MSQQVNNTLTTVKESVSTVFRHILPGIFIIAVGMISWPSWFENLDLTETNTVILLGAVAMAIGNVWHVFHRYFILQVLDFIAYYFRFKGQPIRKEKTDYRSDLAKHVSNFFSTTKSISFGKHIRDRFSSFNFMFMVSEILLFFWATAEDNSILSKYRLFVLINGIVGFLAAFWQYLIVRSIDAEHSISSQTLDKPDGDL